MGLESFISVSVGIGGGFFGGLLLGYALKKVVRLIAVMAVIAGLFIAGLAYLQYQQITSINWDKIEGIITPLANTMTGTINDYNIETLGMADFGMPLTGGMSAGLVVGFMKG